uniref:disease resistance protein RUN1-like n=1 Tax=Erigeron canadensis TaxID=72917 RepID=UPI001CB939CB|nr:disease resistance protein RUN1-like [Erigeron canadensis]
MQKLILTSVFGDQSIEVPSDFEGNSMMKRRMPSIKKVVVLDDVNDPKLLAEPSWFRPGSGIIITLRDKQSPSQGYEELSKEVLRYAAGLPLTIKTLSSSIRAPSTVVWEDAIKRLETIPWGDTLKILKISYDALEEDQKDIFLHKSLIIFRDDHYDDDDKVLDMHDHIEETGMHILRRLDPDEPERHKLLWIKDEIEHIVKDYMVLPKLRLLDFSRSELETFDSAGMTTNIEELVLRGCEKLVEVNISDE